MNRDDELETIKNEYDKFFGAAPAPEKKKKPTYEEKILAEVTKLEKECGEDNYPSL